MSVLRDKNGNAVYDAYVPCIANDVRNLTSNCVFKDSGHRAATFRAAEEAAADRRPGRPGADVLVDEFPEFGLPGAAQPASRGVQVYVGDLGIGRGHPAERLRP